MEESISTLSKTLSKFCNHVESSSSALKQSIDRRPIHLPSASSTFVNYLNRQVSGVSGDVNLLESMVSGTVSFEELLGHCNEVYKKNESEITLIENRLVRSGYVPETENEEVEVFALSSTFTSNLKISDDLPSPRGEQNSAKGSIFYSLEDDPLLEESPSLKNLGFSDVSLASLAFNASGKIDGPNVCVQQPKKHHGAEAAGIRMQSQPSTRNYVLTESSEQLVDGKFEDELNYVAKAAIIISKEDYESVSSSIRSLASWEDLVVAVEKMNSSLSKKEKTRGSYFFHRDDISSFDLGPKATCFLLLLVRMNKLVVETIDGKISYRVL